MFHHVAVRAPDVADAQAARRAMSQLSLPSGVRPAQILLLRRVTDPLPGQLFGPSGLSPAWIQALSGELDRQRRRAVPAGRWREAQDAIVFADEAEMLALLMRTGMQQGARPWWWAGACTHLGVSGFDNAALMRARPQAVPAAVKHLGTHRSHSVLAVLSEGALREIVILVLQVFQVPGAASIWRLIGTQTDGAQDTTAESSGKPDAAALSRAVSSHYDVVQPEKSGAPDAYAVGARVAPSSSQTDDAAASDPASSAEQNLASVWGRLDAQTRFVALMELLAASPAAVAATDDSVLTRLLAASSRQPVTARQGSDRSASAEVRAAPDVAPAGESAGAPAAVTAVRAQAVDGEPSAHELLQDPEPVDDAVIGGAELVTDLAGIFYLLNVCQPPGNERPWRWLMTLARAGLDINQASGTPDEFHTDPLWRLLQALDEEAVETAKEARTGARTEAAPQSDQEEDSARWLRDATAALTAGFDLPAGAAWRQLLVVPGRVYSSPMHIDVVMALRGIRMPVRRQGWDINPGWRPDFGRVFSFYFREELGDPFRQQVADEQR